MVTAVAGRFPLASVLADVSTTGELQRSMSTVAFAGKPLAFTVTPQMLPDPNQLKTDNEAIKHYLPELYNFAPGAYIYLQVATTQPPTVSNTDIYVLTQAAADKLDLPDNVLTTITRMIDTRYPDLTSFETQLHTMLTPEDYQTYGKAIIAAVQTQIWLFLDTQVLVEVLVMKQEVMTFAFSFQVEKKDIFQQFAVSLDSKQSTQMLTFDFGEISQSEKLVQSVIGDITNFDNLWVLANIYLNQELSTIGQQGVALPSLEGFLFDNTTITLFDQNVGVDTDVFYGNVAQLLYARGMRERRSERAKHTEKR